MEKASEKQIAEWKAQHGKIFCISVGEKRCYLKRPSRRSLGAAQAAGKESPVKMCEVILRECWLAGDEEIRTDDNLFMSTLSSLPNIIKWEESELEEL